MLSFIKKTGFRICPGFLFELTSKHHHNVFFIVFRLVLDKSFRSIAKKTKNKFDDFVIENITGH